MYLLKKNRHTIFGRKVEFMEKSKKRVRVCLLCVVIIAVVMGILYYYHDMNKDGLQAEGTLVKAELERWIELCQ